MNKQLRVAVGLVLLGALAWQSDWAQIAGAFRGLRLELWLAALGVYLGTQVISSLRWQLLARALGLGRSLAQLTGFYFVGMYFNLLLPTSVGGDVVRAYYLDGRSGRRLAAFASVAADRASGLMALLVMACVAAALAPAEWPGWVRASVWLSGVGFGVGALAGWLVARRASPAGRLGRLAEAIGLYARRPRLLLATTFMSVLVQAGNVAVVWLVGRGVGAPVPGAYYWVVVPMVTLLTLLPVSVNGMGVREGGMALFLAPLGVERGTALGVAFLWFLVFMAAGLCGGVIYLLGCFPRPEVQPENDAVGHHSDQGRARQPGAAA